MPILSEVFATGPSDAAAVGFVLARLALGGRTQGQTQGQTQGKAPILWVQDRLSRQESGSPYLPGLPGLCGRPVIRVDVSRPADALWAMEEGLRCKALAAVIGEISGDPPALNFTATKRLALRAEASKVPCWLIRRAGSADLSAARDRWRITSLPSAPHPYDPQAPGAPRWRAELFRSRHHQPGIWVTGDERAADPVSLSAAFRDGTLAAGDGKAERRAAR